jgi:hypothetical protein
MGAAGQQEA